jgi:orotidine-5'-phosphate decarboxylase
VKRGLEAGVDGLVVGGTYTVKDKDFLRFVEMINESEALYLIPGIGAQGGEIKEFLKSGIKSEKCIVSSGRDVMFPKGAKSTPEQQAQAAKELRDEFRKASGF